jgi:hypothetical protein
MMPAGPGATARDVRNGIRRSLLCRSAYAPWKQRPATYGRASARMATTPRCRPPPTRPALPSRPSSNLQAVSPGTARPSRSPAPPLASRTSPPRCPVRPPSLRALPDAPTAAVRPGRPRAVLASGSRTARLGRPVTEYQGHFRTCRDCGMVNHAPIPAELNGYSS